MSRKYQPEPTRQASDCWDWITADQAADLGRQAFHLAQHGIQPPEGTPWIASANGRTPFYLRMWATREMFEESLWECFQGFVRQHAQAAGLKGYDKLARDFASYQRNIAFGAAQGDTAVSTTGTAQASQ
jgi:hypothetical protein